MKMKIWFQEEEKPVEEETIPEASQQQPAEPPSTAGTNQTGELTVHLFNNLLTTATD